MSNNVLLVCLVLLCVLCGCQTDERFDRQISDNDLSESYSPPAGIDPDEHAKAKRILGESDEDVDKIIESCIQNGFTREERISYYKKLASTTQVVNEKLNSLNQE